MLLRRSKRVWFHCFSNFNFTVTLKYHSLSVWETLEITSRKKQWHSLTSWPLVSYCLAKPLGWFRLEPIIYLYKKSLSWCSKIRLPTEVFKCQRSLKIEGYTKSTRIPIEVAIELLYGVCREGHLLIVSLLLYFSLSTCFICLPVWPPSQLLKQWIILNSQTYLRLLQQPLH